MRLLSTKQYCFVESQQGKSFRDSFVETSRNQVVLRIFQKALQKNKKACIMRLLSTGEIVGRREVSWTGRQRWWAFGRNEKLNNFKISSKSLDELNEVL